MIVTQDRNLRKKRRVRSKISGTAERPRIAVHRSNQFIYAQAIDDVSKSTIASASSLKTTKDGKKQTKSEAAKEVGRILGKTLQEKKIVEGVFDRSRFAYNGRVKMVAEGIRETGFKI